MLLHDYMWQLHAPGYSLLHQHIPGATFFLYDFYSMIFPICCLVSFFFLQITHEGVAVMGGSTSPWKVIGNSEGGGGVGRWIFKSQSFERKV